MRLFEGTEFDRPPMCERCDQPEAECVCPPETKPLLAPGKQTARLGLEKRAKGKAVTVVRGLPAAANDLPALLTRLKSVCGAGGTLQEDTLEIQGDQRDRVRGVLEKIGYRVKG